MVVISPTYHWGTRASLAWDLSKTYGWVIQPEEELAGISRFYNISPLSFSL